MKNRIRLANAHWQNYKGAAGTFAMFLKGDNTNQFSAWYVFDPIDVATVEQVILTSKVYASGVGNNGEYECYIDNITAQVHGQNMGNHCAEVDMWYLFPRRSIPKTLDVNGVTTTPIIQGNLTWDITNTTNTQASNWLYNGLLNNVWSELKTDMPTMPMPDLTPHMSRTTAELFKIKYAKHYQINPGAEMDFKWSWKPKRIMSTKSFAPFELTSATPISTSWGKCKGTGPLILLRARGCFVHDETNLATATTVRATQTNVGEVTVNQTRGNFAIAFTAQRKARFKHPVISLEDRAIWLTKLTGAGFTDPTAITNANQNVWNPVAPAEAAFDD